MKGKMNFMLGMDVQFNIISYAVVSTKYEASSSLIESFLPLVEYALSRLDGDCVEEVGINDVYEEVYGYRIHSAILSQLLKVLKRQGKIIRIKNERIQVKKNLLKAYDLNQEYEYKLRALISEVDIFLKRKGHAVKREVIIKSIIKFLVKNVIDFNSFINYNSNFEQLEEDNLENNELIDFFIEERRNNTKHYEFLKDIYAGIVLSSIIIADENEVDSFHEDFYVGNVLLDSNYIFRLLDLQTSLEFEAAQETYCALKENGCQFWVCKETIKQIADTLRTIISQCPGTVHSVLQIGMDKRFTGLASACIRRSLTAAQLQSIIDQIEGILKEKFDVLVVDENEFNLDLIDIPNEDFWELRKIKPDASDFGLSHDLLLIHIITSKRSKTLYQAEKANWWLLTDDNKLTNWNIKKVGVQGIPECITESQLATVMWLCNPKKSSLDGLFNTVIALRSQGLAGNTEYIKISKEIERQKERYADDEAKLRKLSLVLSQRVLGVEDFLSDDYEELDAKFDQMLYESQEEMEEKDRKIEEQKQKIDIYEKKSVELLDKYKGTSSLLSEKSEKLIISLKSRVDDKQSQRNAVQNEIIVLKEQKDKQIKRIFQGLKLLLVMILALVLWKSVPLIDKLESWYLEHGFLCFILSISITWVGTFLGLKVEKVKDLFFLMATKVEVFFAKRNFIRDFNNEINPLKQKKDELFEEINCIQEQIDVELGKC